MTNYYIDVLNGSDSNDGLSWVDSWKTFSGGPTSEIILPGDIIKIAKSPDPTLVGQATWNNLSYNVTLDSAVTQTITNCETQWLPTTNTYSFTTRKEGSYSARLYRAVSSTNKMAYTTLPSTLDLSSYTRLSFWFGCSRTFSSGEISIRLCSDTSGDVVVNELFVPDYVTYGVTASACKFIPIVIDYGSALGSNINSVSVYRSNITVAHYVYLDNVIACKSEGNDALTLRSLISKESTSTGYTEGWFAIRSIDGVNINLDTTPHNAIDYDYGYIGDTEKVNTYKRECVNPENYVTNSTGNSVAVSGEEDNYIEYQGGWNTSTDEQDGETFLDGYYGTASAFLIDTKDYIKVNRLSAVRFSYGFYLKDCNNILIDTSIQMSYMALAGLYWYKNSSSYFDNCVVNRIGNLCYSMNGHSNDIPSYGLFDGYINIKYIHNIVGNTNAGFLFKGTYRDAYLLEEAYYIDNNYKGIITTAGCSNCRFGIIHSISNNKDFGMELWNTYNLRIDEIINHYDNDSGSFPDNNIGSFISNTQNMYIGSMISSGHDNATIASNYNLGFVIDEATISDTRFLAESIHNNDFLLINNKNSTGNSYLENSLGNIMLDSSVRYTENGKSLKFTTVSTVPEYKNWTNTFTIADIYCRANKEVSFTTYARRTSTNVYGRLLCEKLQLSGITEDVYLDMTGDIDTWETMNITFTPTETGVVKIKFFVWGLYNESVYVHTINVSQS